jgi:predicted DNA-binding transcriptional regulator YafY
MNRTDRLLAIILELQRHKVLRAEDLAATFETSKRTIYRDLDALAESGVPLLSTPGQGYSLIEGFFLPPVSFTRDEATMLLLGADYLSHNFDAQYRAAAQTAAAKIEGVLGEKLREEVRAMQVALQTVSVNVDAGVLDKLRVLRRAILESKRIQLRYFARFGDAARSQVETRELEPHMLVLADTTWYLLARDLKHDDMRRFRLERMEAIALTETPFARPSTEQLAREHNRNVRQEFTMTVRALFDKSVARWVRESRNWFVVDESESDAGLLLTFQVRHEDELLQYLLQWGGQVQVLEPNTLRKRMRAEAEKMVAAHQTLLT